MSKLSTPLKTHGGKFYLADKIVAMMPKHRNYVEPFAGGLSVLLAKDHANTAEVINDVDHLVTVFWRVMAHPTMFRMFRRKCEATPFGQTFWVRHRPNVRNCKNQSQFVNLAFDFFRHIRMSLAGRGKSFAPITTTRLRRGMNEQASAWLGAVEGLTEVHERLKGVVVLNEPAVGVIEKMDDPETLFYCDPPYVHSTRATTNDYYYEMTDDQHRSLLSRLASIEGKFMLSGYRSQLYDSYADEFGWNRTEFELPNNAAGGKSKRKMVECVWTNFEIEGTSK